MSASGANLFVVSQKVGAVVDEKVVSRDGFELDTWCQQPIRPGKREIVPREDILT
jgi:hypothetical protein